MRFDSFIQDNAFQRNNFDFCVYFKKFEDQSLIYLIIYVNDILIATKYQSEIKKLKEMLGAEFDINDLGPVKKILRMNSQKDRIEN